MWSFKQMVKKLSSALLSIMLSYTVISPDNSHASEVCDFCTPSVTLNEERAKCFLAIYNNRLEKLYSSNVGFVRVNFGECSGRKTSGSKGVVDPGGTIPNEISASEIVFLDETGLKCLKNTIDTDKTGFTPTKELQLDVICQ